MKTRTKYTAMAVITAFFMARRYLRKGWISQAETLVVPSRI